MSALNPKLAASNVVTAVQHAIAKLPQDLQQTLGLQPLSAETYQTQEGDWVVPVASGASPAMQRSHQLHRILSDIQLNAEDELRATITVILAA